MFLYTVRPGDHSTNLEYWDEEAFKTDGFVRRAADQVIPRLSNHCTTPLQVDIYLQSRAHSLSHPMPVRTERPGINFTGQLGFRFNKDEKIDPELYFGRFGPSIPGIQAYLMHPSNPQNRLLRQSE